MRKRFLDWLDESRVVGIVAGLSLSYFGWTFIGWLWENEERSREDKVRACRAGCVNIASKHDFLGSGFLIKGRSGCVIEELRQRLREKYEEYTTQKLIYADFKYLIVTNYHVVKAVITDQTKLENFMLGGHDSIHISPAEPSLITGDSGKFSARVVAYEEASDLALLTIVFNDANDASIAQDLSGFKTGLHFDPNDPKLLDTVYAFGCPQKFNSSVTKGIISHTNRKIKKKLYYQTDAAINHGNSGGPLINNHARVVGVATIKLENETAQRADEHVENISFAIPACRVKEFLRKLENPFNELDIKDGTNRFYTSINQDLTRKSELIDLLADELLMDESLMDELITKFELTNVGTLELSASYFGNFIFTGRIKNSVEEHILTEPQLLVVYEAHDEETWQPLTIDTWSKLLNRNIAQFRCFNKRSVEDIDRDRHYIITATKT